MNLKHLRIFCCLIVVFSLFTTVSVAEGLGTLLSRVDGNRNTVSTVEFQTLTGMMEYAAENENTIFELLNASAMYLKEKNWRVRIDGDDLRAVNRRFDLGGARVNALLPVEKIIYIEIGSSLNTDKPEMEVHLSEKFSDFLEIGDFYLSRNFGFKALDNAWFKDAFGIKVKYLIFKMNLSGIELYDTNKIAIYASSFPKPKRWRIDPVRERG